ncbi:Wzz/FepE/Etk N-terminal domain-containing protein [Streptomyces sp. HSW2009]|uniref:Wzz/FepE/Etk N-terminal domain-containing protein n=1 Tax=Streptomyces sp. HSW2009 TaxID=3142890 RepID=UPI0032F001D7
MSDDTIRLVTIGRMLRWRWRLLVALAVAGALLGLGASVLFPPRYTASASVLLPGQWEQRELLTQAHIATSSTVVDRVADSLHWSGVGGRELRDRVSAKTTDGNIIKVSGTAESPARAQRLADRLAEQFVAFTARLSGAGGEADAVTGPEALRQKVAQTNRRITELADAADPGRTVESVQARTALEKLRTALEEAMKKLDEVDPAANKAGMVVMGPATRPGSATPPTRGQLVVAGALLFVLAGSVWQLAARRGKRRLRTESEIAAALGTSLLGTVEVATGRSADRPAGQGPRAVARRLLGMDTRWDLPAPRAYGDEASRRLRYRRVCARLRSQLPLSRGLLVLVPDGDEIARRAAEQLVAEAASAPQGSPSGGGLPALRVVAVAVDQPMVPDRETESGAVVLLSAGSWSAAELGGIAGACADGGHEVVGVVVAGLVRADTAGPADPPPADEALALAVGGDAPGGSA